MPDQFETSFSNIAYSYLQEKAINLLDYLVGFEVVDKDDNGSKGLGIFAFQVGERYIYAPVFFLAGEIKPLELLYLRDKDVFVPLSEEWVDYLLKNKPLELGQGVKMDRQTPFSQPDLDIFSTPPITGKHVTAAVRDMIGTKGIADVVGLGAEPTIKAMCFLQESPSRIKRAFLKSAAKDERFLRTLVENYGWDLVKEASRDEAPDYKMASGFEKCANCKHFKNGMRCDKYDFEASPAYTCDSWAPLFDKKASTRFFDQDTPIEQLRDLTPEQREAVFRGETAFSMNKQAEKEESNLYYSQFEDDLQNPHSSGHYRLVDHTGDIRDVLVLKDPQGAALYGEHKPTVVDIKSGRFVNAPVSEIWVKKWAGVEDKPNFENGLEKLTEARNIIPIKKGKIGKTYLLINRQLNSSAPFVIKQQLTSANGLVTYLIDWVEGEKAYPVDTEQTRNTRNVSVSTDIQGRSEENAGTDRGRAHQETHVGPIRMVLSPKAGTGNEKLYLLGDEMIVPDTFELLPLTKPGKKGPKFGMGGPGVLYDKLKNVTKYASLRLWSDGYLFTINYDGKQQSSLTKRAALDHLAGNIKLNPQVAFTLVSGAEKTPRRPQDYFVKRAYPGALQGAPSGIMDPTFTGDISVAPGGKQLFNEELVTTPNEYPNPEPMGEGENLYTGQIGQPGAAEMGNPHLAIDQAMQASQLGQQQVFDHAMLGVLANASDISEMIHKYMPDLEGALDKLGRLLFLFWWHQEHFKELFGVIKLTELEDKLRQTFKQFGELVLELKQKERLGAGEL